MFQGYCHKKFSWELFQKYLFLKLIQGLLQNVLRKSLRNVFKILFINCSSPLPAVPADIISRIPQQVFRSFRKFSKNFPCKKRFSENVSKDFSKTISRSSSNIPQGFIENLLQRLFQFFIRFFLVNSHEILLEVPPEGSPEVHQIFLQRLLYKLLLGFIETSFQG